MKVTENRLDLMDTVTVDGVQEKDPLTMRYREIDPQREVRRHEVLLGEVSRPDMISLLEYQSSGFWWFILAFNGVIDPYDVSVETQLTITDMLDYYAWFRQQKDEKETT